MWKSTKYDMLYGQNSTYINLHYGTKQVICILSTHHISQSEEFFVPREGFSQVPDPSLGIFSILRQYRYEVEI